MAKLPPRAPEQLENVCKLLSVNEADIGSARASGAENVAAGFDGARRDEAVVSWLYRILDTLDSKASHLLALNGLVIVAQTFLFSALPPDQPDVVRWVWGGLVLVPIVGAVFGLWVFRISWSFLGSENDTDDDRSLEPLRAECWRLADACQKRTHHHRAIWWFTIASITLLVPAVVYYMLQ